MSGMFPNSSSGVVMIGDRVMLRTPQPYFSQLVHLYPPNSLGYVLQPYTPSCDVPLIIPMLVKMSPGQEGPKFYLGIHGNIVDFLYGSFVGVYIGYQTGYLQDGIELQILKHIRMGTDGWVDAAGTFRAWIRWIWEDRWDALFFLWRTFIYGMGGGVLQTLMRMLYRWFCCSDGHIVPALGTFVIMSIGDDNFFGCYRILGNLIYYTVIFETGMMLGFRGNSTYWMRHFLERYILRPFLFLHSPKKWFSDEPYSPSI